MGLRSHTIDVFILNTENVYILILHMKKHAQVCQANQNLSLDPLTFRGPL